VLSRSYIFVLIAVFTLSFLQACATEYNPVTGRQEMIFISPQQESSMGRNIARQVEEKYKVLKDPVLQERLYRVAEKLIPVQGRRDIVYHFEVLDDDDINAFTLPGGYIYVFRGLMEFVKNDDELAYIIGHEMGHNVAKHAVKKMQGAMGAQLLLLLSTQADSPGFTRGMELALASIFSEYSQEDEFLADELGIKYAREAGYDPSRAIDFMERLQEYSRKKLRPITYFKTHPYLSSRMTRIKKILGLPLSVKDFINE